MNYVCCYRNEKGQVIIRCKDGLWRKRPWMGTFGSCMSLHTYRGAKRIESNAIKRYPQGQIRIIKVEEAYSTCADIWQRARENWGTPLTIEEEAVL